MVKFVSISVSLLFNASLFGQYNSEETGLVNFYVGAKTRVTPIYLKTVPGFIHIGNIDVLEQPNKYLSGPGLNLSERIILGKNWSVSFSQTIRYDYIYQRLPLESPPPSDFDYSFHQKIIFDLYTDFMEKIASGKPSYFSFLVGFAICGLNSDFNQTLRIHGTPPNYTDYVTRKNFMFPAISTGLGWQWKKLYIELKMGYCWKDPTLFDTPFLFPEISVQYQVFSSLSNKKKSQDNN